LECEREEAIREGKRKGKKEGIKEGLKNGMNIEKIEIAKK
jgi:hypothetical protein